MNKAIKIVIVAVLVIVVAIVIGLKEKNQQSVPETSDTAPPSPESTLMSPQQEKTAKQKLPKLIDLGAGKCVPCKMMAPVLAEIKKEYKGKLEVVFIDVWENPDEAKKYNIKLIPTQIFYDASGKELFRHEGFFSEQDIMAKYKELGIHLQE